MFIGVMKKGDRVISVTSELIAVERKNGEVDIIPLTRADTGLRVDIEGIVTIGFGNNVVKTSTGDVEVITI